MFIDTARINIKGGKGGDGCVSFHRAKYVPKGGPDGGDGGDGGSVIIEADANITTLMDFKYNKRYAAQSGAPGQKNNKSGLKGQDIIIKVPFGTLIKEASTGRVMADMTADANGGAARRVLIKGGTGGRGNAKFATAVRQAPRYAEHGRPAKEYDIILELKLIADVGIIGLPNAGKSSLLAMVTNARPKIANYHFTTLAPNLGVVRLGDYTEFVMADIPGLIAGASQGLGLGHEFLRHAQRSRLFIHVVDAAELEGTGVLEMVEQVNAELAAYDESLTKRPQIIAANKTDLPGSGENVRRLTEAYAPKGVLVVPISAATGAGLDELIAQTAKKLPECDKPAVFAEDFFTASEDITAPENNIADLALNVERVQQGVFEVTSERLRKTLGMTDLDGERGFAFFQKYIREAGINSALINAGIQEGDTVRMYGLEFEYIP